MPIDLYVYLFQDFAAIHCHHPGVAIQIVVVSADKAAATSKLLNKLTFYDRAYAESPDEVAAKAMEGVKKGSFLITSSVGGFLLGVLARGAIPAESAPIALIELALLVPMRIYSFIWFAYMRRILHGKSLKKQEIPVKNTHVSQLVSLRS